MPIDYKKLEKDLEEMDCSEGGKGHCFTCYSRNPNWLGELQDIIEELGFTAEEFAAASEWSNQYTKDSTFVVRKSGLRLTHRNDCVGKKEILELVHELEEKKNN